MTTVLCTLYNSLYLDKGLVLYDSLCECAKDFKLYVLCMDEKCYEVLTDLKQEHHIPVRLSDFEKGDEELLAAKSNRPMGEYCWTCSSSFIRYVLKHYNEQICTYIDADMYFYHDPQVLIDEMLAAGKSVMVVPHRFPDKKMELANKVGTYCVEFNTFRNIPKSLEVLDYWRKRCLECCSNLGDGIHWGDQKYLEELVDKFDCVRVCDNLGAGVAPWNIELYEMKDSNNVVSFRKDKVTVPVVFYHFQAISYINRYDINTSLQKGNKLIDYYLVDTLYVPYLLKLDEKKVLVKRKYGVDVLLRGHPSKKQNLLRTFLKSISIIRKIYNSITHNNPYIVKING